MSPHYLAPATAVIVAILVECCRYLRPAAIPLFPAVMILVLTLRIAAQDLGLPYTQRFNYQSWCCKVEGNLNKHRIESSLLKMPGKSLVFVKPKTDPLNLLQWIYNDADLDSARIIWARDLGTGKNARLMKQYPDREVWLVDPNVEPASCVQYGSAAITQAGAR